MDIGAHLRQAREARGLTIESLAKSTRVQPRILSAIEQNDSVSLPPRPYGRGFVRAYASEVGLDPEGTVREFFSQFVVVDDTPPPSDSRPAHARDNAGTPGRPWAWPVALVLGYAAVGAIVILVGRWAMITHGETGAVGTSGAATPAPAAAIDRQPAPPPVARPDSVTVALEAQRPVWVTAVADGQREVYRTLQPGERVRLSGTREVTVRTGDAGAVTWQVNNGPSAPMGRSGEVRTARVAPETAGQMK